MVGNAPAACTAASIPKGPPATQLKQSSATAMTDTLVVGTVEVVFDGIPSVAPSLLLKDEVGFRSVVVLRNNELFSVYSILLSLFYKTLGIILVG